jgi:ABC-type multidrug transport system ATPase subunit
MGSISNQALNQMMHHLHLGQEALKETVQDRILRGVKSRFDDMHYRYQNVDSPIAGTFEWIFDLDRTSEEAAKFNHWLSSGSDIFHICGKLGSGKSTLMKRIFGHARTRNKLEQWSRQWKPP